MCRKGRTLEHWLIPLQRRNCIMAQNTDLALRVGQNLKHLLEEKGWSQEYAEELISNTFNNGRSIRRWIANGINKLDTIQYIASILEVDVMEFFK